MPSFSIRLSVASTDRNSLCESVGILTPRVEGCTPLTMPNGQGKVQDAVRLDNQQNWEIRNLVITNFEESKRAIRRGVYIKAKDCGELKHIYLKELEVRNVNGLYKGGGYKTNGGIICEVTGKEKPSWFGDLRIENCIFRTKSIDRYCVVVKSSWTNEYPNKVVFTNNTLDHIGRSHLVIPADQWPREDVYYHCPDCHNVFSLVKTANPVCQKCGRVGCEDIFSEMAARMRHVWDFFDATRYEEGKWGLFKENIGDKDFTMWASAVLALASYGEFRSMGFEPPEPYDDDKILDEWIDTINSYIDPNTNQLKKAVCKKNPGYVTGYYASFLRGRVFDSDRFKPSLGRPGRGNFKDKETLIKWLDDYEAWAKNPWGKGSGTGHGICAHYAMLQAHNLPDDGMLEVAHQWLDQKQNLQTGVWGGEKAPAYNTVNGIFKVFVPYESFDWPINHKDKIIDFTLSTADEKMGFDKEGCSVLDPLMVLAVVRKRGEPHRAGDIDEVTAKTFLTFLRNWDERTNWYKGRSWNGKHNNAVPMYMAAIILDQPYFKGSTVYNWREEPIIERRKDGMVIVNKKPLYQMKGRKFEGTF